VRPVRVMSRRDSSSAEAAMDGIGGGEGSVAAAARSLERTGVVMGPRFPVAVRPKRLSTTTRPEVEASDARHHPSLSWCRSCVSVPRGCPSDKLAAPASADTGAVLRVGDGGPGFHCRNPLTRVRE